MADHKRQCSVCGGGGFMLDGSQCPQCSQPVIPAEAVKEIAEVIELGGHNNMTVDEALDVVKRAGPAKVVIIGFRSDGKFFSTNSRMTNQGVLWLLEIAKISLIEDAANAES